MIKSLLSWSLRCDVRGEDKNDHLRVQTGMNTLRKWSGYTKRIGGKAYMQVNMKFNLLKRSEGHLEMSCLQLGFQGFSLV